MYSVIGKDGQTFGPVDLDTLKTWCVEGRITSDTPVVDPIDGQTKRASDLPEVAQHIRPPVAYATRPSYAPPTPPSFSRPIQPTSYGYPAYVASQPKSKIIAILLAVFLGALGIHRFYLGHTGLGIAMLLITVLSAGALAFVTFIWSIIDVVLIATDSLRDSANRPLV